MLGVGLGVASIVWLSLQYLIGGVGAADCAPPSKSFTIKTSDDISSITACSTFTGNIVIAADGPSEVLLDGLVTIVGNIDVENVALLQSFSSNTITTVSSFTLNNLPRLSSLDFHALTNFSDLKWSNLPTLEDCTIATGDIVGDINGISIVNTSLKSVDWLKWPIGSQLNISSNTNLQSFSIPYSTINAGSALTFSSNPALSSIDVSLLTGIYGGLDISENDKISNVSFTKLETVGGFLQMSGDYTNISMPALNGVNGALTVESTGDITGLCNELQDKKLNGHYSCNSNMEKDPGFSNPTATGTPSTATSTAEPTAEPTAASDSRSSFSTGVKIGIAIAALVFTILILIIAFFYFRQRSRAKVREIPQSSKPSDPGSIELAESPTIITSFPKELESPIARVEIADGRRTQELEGVIPQELDARHGASELRTPVSPAASWMSATSDTPLVRAELPA